MMRDVGIALAIFSGGAVIGIAALILIYLAS